MNREAKNILIQVCSFLERDEQDVMEGSRIKQDVEARYIAVAIAVDCFFPTFSLKTIGSWFFPLNSNSAHSMVLHANKKIEQWKIKRVGFKDKMNGCMNMCCNMDFDAIPQL